MSVTVNHEWDEDGQCAVSVTEDQPVWQWRWIDILGIFFSTIAGYFGITSQGLQAVAKECMAHAEYQRTRFDRAEEIWAEEAARAEMAAELEGVVYGPEDLT